MGGPGFVPATAAKMCHAYKRCVKELHYTFPRFFKQCHYTFPRFSILATRISGHGLPGAVCTMRTRQARPEDLRAKLRPLRAVLSAGEESASAPKRRRGGPDGGRDRSRRSASRPRCGSPQGTPATHDAATRFPVTDPSYPD